VGFFQDVLIQRIGGLLQIPGTAAPRVAQLPHDADQPAEFFHVVFPKIVINKTIS
jgi:hypothetical protein